MWVDLPKPAGPWGCLHGLVHILFQVTRASGAMLRRAGRQRDVAATATKIKTTLGSEQLTARPGAVSYTHLTLPTTPYV